MQEEMERRVAEEQRMKSKLLQLSGSMAHGGTGEGLFTGDESELAVAHKAAMVHHQMKITETESTHIKAQMKAETQTRERTEGELEQMKTENKRLRSVEATLKAKIADMEKHFDETTLKLNTNVTPCLPLTACFALQRSQPQRRALTLTSLSRTHRLPLRGENQRRRRRSRRSHSSRRAQSRGRYKTKRIS